MKILLFHIFAVVESICALCSYYRYVDIHSLGYGRELKFMTVINMWLQLSYFSLSLLYDIFSSQGLKKFKDIFYAAIIFPTCLSVIIFFWPVYWYDRELIHPKANDLYIPKWANHFWHTFILISVVEAFVANLKYPSRKTGLSLSYVFGLLYFSFILWIYYAAGFWAYPFLDGLGLAGYLVFVIVQLLISTVYYLFGEFCNNVIGSYNEEEKKKQ